MTTQPPYLINYNLPGFGSNWQSVPEQLWKYFCDHSTAAAMLGKASGIDPACKVFDLLDPRVPLPPNVGRFPLELRATDAGTDISMYIVYGAVSLKTGEESVLYEFCGWLADTQNGALHDQLDQQALSVSQHLGIPDTKAKLFAYVSPVDPQDSDCYWADQPVLGGLAA